MSETYDVPPGRHRSAPGGNWLRRPRLAALSSGGGFAAVAAVALTIVVIATALIVELGGTHHTSPAGAGSNAGAGGPGAPLPGAGPAVSPAGAGAATSPSAGPTATVAPSTPAPPPAAGCTLGQLSISVSNVDRGDAGMGHSSSALLFRNIGSAPCEMSGYPAVTALDKHGRVVATAKTSLRGYMGGLDANRPPTVRLAPGQSASALVEALNANPDGSGCRLFAMLRVTPPGASGSTTVAWGRASGCANLEVHPIVPGASGRM